MATDKPRFSLTLDEATMNDVINYQKRHGLSTKSRAIQALVRSGLEDYIESSPSPAGSEEDDIKVFTSMVSQLSDEHKRFLLVVIEALIELEQGQLSCSQAKADKTE